MLWKQLRRAQKKYLSTSGPSGIHLSLTESFIELFIKIAEDLQDHRVQPLMIYYKSGKYVCENVYMALRSLLLTQFLLSCLSRDRTIVQALYR